MKKKLIIISIILILIGFAIFIAFKIKNNKNNKIEEIKDYTGPLSGQINENIERKTKEEDIIEGIIIESNNINLDEYKSNITINAPGTYTLYGKLNATIIIDANETVELNMKNVIIEGQITSAIINKQNNKLIVNVLEETKNYLSDNGNSVYPSVIYSNGEIIINGSGELNIISKQLYSEGISTENKNITINSGVINIEATDDGINAGGDLGGTITINDGNLYIKAQGDAIDSNKDLIINGGTLYATGGITGNDGAIDTDEGYVINNGNLIALGYNHLEMPQKSKIYTLGINLNEDIEAEQILTLTNEYNTELVSFVVKNKINKILISHQYINQGKYMLFESNTHSGNLEQGIYKDGNVEIKNNIKINDKNSISIFDTITEIK